VKYAYSRRLAEAAWRYMPFTDLVGGEVRLRQLLRLSLFQISVGMVQTLFFGTLNRVMIVELGVSAALVSVFIAIPLLVAPFRALVGFRSDTHRSVLGWRRVPFILMGTLLQFGGLAIMPFALLAFTDGTRPYARVIGYAASGLAFFLTGAGAHTTQTAGLALATDLAPDRLRPRVIALMYLTMLLGNVISAFALGGLLRDFTPQRLIEVVQGCAMVTAVFNGVALWKQEARVPGSQPYRKGERRPMFRQAWRVFTGGGRAVRLLVAVSLGFFAFNMQDVLLEPYGGEILRLTVGSTTALTGIMAAGAIASFATSALLLERGLDPVRLAALGVGLGIAAFAMVVFAAPLGSPALFRAGTALIGYGEGSFGVGTLCAAMALRDPSQHGIALGAWGAVFATAEGVALSVSGVIKDALSTPAAHAILGPGLSAPSVPYSVVYHLEILFLFATLVALGPLAAARGERVGGAGRRFELADVPA
jgi:BCD family chlorophyll transporter-like MFS transporter